MDAMRGEKWMEGGVRIGAIGAMRRREVDGGRGENEIDEGEGVLLLVVVARARRAPAGRAQAWALSLGREGLQERARGAVGPCPFPSRP